MASVTSGLAQETDEYERPPINYSHETPNDAVARLRAEISSGALKFTGTDREIVQKLLGALNIPVASQMLVFSRTSFQKDRISPAHPRALYFSDNCYVGWVPGGLVEITTVDPRLGPVFYSFDPRPVRGPRRPEFARDNDCLRCHGGTFVPGIPAVFARSLYAARDGEPFYRQGTEVVDDHTPFSHRWGGWYVTGTHGSALHRGNNFARENGDELVFNPAAGANITNLAPFFDTTEYLTDTSDIAALLVFEHQTAMQNTLTRAGMVCRRMLFYQQGLQTEFKEPGTIEPTYEVVRNVFDHSAVSVVDELLFKDEAELPEFIQGSLEFQKQFSATAKRARNGDSLKDLLVSDHLFQNRCSYLIYSDTFHSLPSPLKSRIYARLAKALDPLNPDLRYTYIHTSERKRIRTILVDTLPEFREALPKH